MAKFNIMPPLKLNRTSRFVFETISGAKNCIYERFGTDKQFVTQRAGFFVSESNPLPAGNERAGVIFQSFNSNKLYFSYNAKIYLNSYSNEIYGVASISGRIYMCENGGDIFVNDFGNNSALFINSSDVVAPISELNAIISGNGLSLARGCVTLNGITYAQMKSGEIYNSAVEDISSWSELDFISSELLEDSAFYIDSLNNHIVTFNSRSIEFFYDNANPTASPLSVRTDVSFQIGALNENCYFKSGDSIYFLGTTQYAGVSLYVLSNFKITKISDGDLDEVFNMFTFPSVSGFYYKGRVFVTIGTPSVADNNMIVYDSQNGQFYQMNYFDKVFISSNSAGDSSAIPSKIIIDNGDIISLNFNFPAGQASDFTFSEIGTPISSEILIEDSNFDTNEFKRIKKLSVNSRPAKTDFHVEVEASTNGISKFKRQFNISGNIDTRKAQRLGRFKTIDVKVNFGGIIGDDLSPSSNEYVQIKSLEVDL